MRRLPLSDAGILVTGAAGGIGTAIARRIVADGGRVALLDLEGPRLRRLAGELGDGAGIAVPADVRDRTQVVEGVNRAAEQLGGLQGAILGAGVVRPDLVLEQREQQARWIVDVNLFGTLWSLQAAVPHIDRRAGHVLLLSSIGALAPVPLSGVYPATKAAAGALVAQMRTELMHRPTTAGVVYLGSVDTPMAEDVRRDPRMGRAARRTAALLTRSLEPEDVARRIVGGLRRRARVIVAPRWQAPAALPHLAMEMGVGLVMRRTGLARELPREPARPARREDPADGRPAAPPAGADLDPPAAPGAGAEAPER